MRSDLKIDMIGDRQGRRKMKKGKTMMETLSRRDFSKWILGAGVCAATPIISVRAKADDCAERVKRRRDEPAIMLHRGCSDLAVENSLAAYELTFLYGGDGLEVDIHETRDGTLVMLHDDWLDRVVDHYAIGAARPATR